MPREEYQVLLQQASGTLSKWSIGLLSAGPHYFHQRRAASGKASRSKLEGSHKLERKNEENERKNTKSEGLDRPVGTQQVCILSYFVEFVGVVVMVVVATRQQEE